MTRSERMKAHWADPIFVANFKASRAVGHSRRKWGEAKAEREERLRRRALCKKEEEEKQQVRLHKHEIHERVEQKYPLNGKAKSLNLSDLIASGVLVRCGCCNIAVLVQDLEPVSGYCKECLGEQPHQES